VTRSGPAPDSAGRLAYVDGLRAVAVLLVILFHTRVHMPGVELGQFFKECSHGVDLFFVLSGFCLALPTLERLQGAGRSRFDVAGFAAKRCLRILPPYFVAVLLFAAAGSVAVAHGIPLPPGMPAKIDWADIPGQLLFFDRNAQYVNRSFWTLAVEFRWYLVFPLALALWSARPRALLLAIGLIVLAAEETRATSTDLGVLDAFLLGIVAAQIYVSRHPIASRGLAFFVGGSAFGLILERSYHFPIQTNVGWHIAAFGLVIYAGQAAWLQRVLANPLLVAVGVASYSIYLVHEPIVSSVGIALSPSVGVTLAGAAAFGAAVAAGFFLWAIVERPITDRLLVGRVVRKWREPIATFLERVHVPSAFDLLRAARLGDPDMAESRERTPVEAPV
jgi:peptidoglycan/LPS O-acetylase OafA/YrhL